VAHAAVLAASTKDLPAAAVAAEPVLLEVAGRRDPPQLRQVIHHLAEVADPDAAEARVQRQHDRRGLWVSPSLAGMVAIDGLLEPDAGETLLAALEPLARPGSAEDEHTGSQRRADALTELARRALEGGRLPQTGGVRPQVTVTIELASLLGQPGTPGGTGAWIGPLPTETARRLACDAAVTRVLVTRHHPHADHHPAQERDRDGDGAGDLAARLSTAITLLPPALGGAPPSRWRSAAPLGSSRRPNGPRWRSATAAAATPAATGHRPGARPTTCATGYAAAPPIWATWCCCAAPTTAPSTKAASACTHHIEDSPPRPEAHGRMAAWTSPPCR
jgi:hypothetical protein